jgi:hypothetical protein
MQSYIDEIVRNVDSQERSAVFIYAGDFDPSGEDIQRDFLARTDCWQAQHRIALNPSQIAQYNLPPLPGKTTDSRAGGFIARHGQLMQVELDALDPNVLRDLYRDEIMRYFDEDLWMESKAREARERKQLRHGDIVLSSDYGEWIMDYINNIQRWADKSSIGGFIPQDVEAEAIEHLRTQVFEIQKATLGEDDIGDLRLEDPYDE